MALVWRPFLLGPIFADQGWDDSPFNLYPVKGRYMWRDLERLCEKHALPFRRPSTFPRNGLLAARVACCNQDRTWVGAFTRAVFEANFARDLDIGRPEVTREILDGLGLDADRIVGDATSDTGKQALRDQTESARALGIFGAPSFVVDGELFWGNDRLGDAVASALLPR